MSFEGQSRQLGLVGDDIVEVTPADGADLPDGTCVAIWVTGTSGDVCGVMASGRTVTIPVVASEGPDGIYPFRFKRIKSTGTTATGIEAIY